MKILPIILSLIFCTNAYAADYYVATTGNDTTGDGSIGNPWATPAFGAASVSAGDTLYIRAGTYDITTPENNNYSGVAPHADNVTIAGYTGETAILRGNGGVAPTNCVIGSGYYDGTDHFADGLTIDNLTIRGMVSMVWGTGITLKNSHISIGGDSWTGNEQGAVVWLQGCVDCVVQNNTIVQSYAAPGGSSSAIITYSGVSGLLIENNDITATAGPSAGQPGGTGITLKDTVTNAVVRYNYIHDCEASGLWSANQGLPHDIVIYQNIFSNNNTGDSDNGDITHVLLTYNLDIYNNTFYASNKGAYFAWSDAVPLNSVAFFNNIVFEPVLNFVGWYYSAPFSASYLDYNNYYKAASPQWVINYTGYTTFAAYQTACQAELAGCDQTGHTVTTDPGFINASGLYNTPADFKRASYTANGRGGIYPAAMGAYVTGSETIGYSGAGLPESECDFDHPSLCLTSETCYAVAGLYWCNETCQVGACAGRKFKVKRIIHPE